jgi:hypothetical protein
MAKAPALVMAEASVATPKAPADLKLAWWSLVKSEHSPFGPYDYFSARLFRLTGPNGPLGPADTENSEKPYPPDHEGPGEAIARKLDDRQNDPQYDQKVDQEGGQKGDQDGLISHKNLIASPLRPNSLQVVLKKSDLTLMGHRPVAAGEPVYIEASPLVHDGAWYVFIKADSQCVIDVLSSLVIGGNTVYAQTKASLYPPKAVSNSPPLKLDRVNWPILTVKSPARAAFRMLAGSKLILEAKDYRQESLMVLDYGSFNKLSVNDSDLIEYFVSDDPLLNLSGYSKSKEIVLFSLLRPKGREAQNPVLVSFSFEVFRNQAIHASQKGAVWLFIVTVVLAFLLTLVYRRRFGLDD